MKPERLSKVTDAIEALAGQDFVANRTQAGYWKQIALAAEEVAGTPSNAAEFLYGWMRRAAIAIGVKTGFSGAGYNPRENGYLKWMIDALESDMSVSTVGSLEKRFTELIEMWNPGGAAVWILATGIWNDSGDWIDSENWID